MEQVNRVYAERMRRSEFVIMFCADTERKIKANQQQQVRLLGTEEKTAEDDLWPTPSLTPFQDGIELK